MQAVLGRIALLDDALGVARYRERGHDQCVGILAVDDDELLAIDGPAIALFLGRGRDVVEVVARVLLELREREGLSSVDDGRDVRGLLRIRATMAQKTAADHDGGEIRLQHQGLAERFHHDHGLDRAGAEAAVVFGKGKAEQALLGELAPDGLAPAALLLHVFLALLELVSVVQEAVDAIFQEPLLLGQIEIHFLHSLSQLSQFSVMPALVAGIHVLLPSWARAWMAGSSPAMTAVRAAAS